jgi:hypothetical protein
MGSPDKPLQQVDIHSFCRTAPDSGHLPECASLFEGEPLPSVDVGGQVIGLCRQASIFCTKHCLMLKWVASAMCCRGFLKKCDSNSLNGTSLVSECGVTTWQHTRPGDIMLCVCVCVCVCVFFPS